MTIPRLIWYDRKSKRYEAGAHAPDGVAHITILTSGNFGGYSAALEVSGLVRELHGPATTIDVRYGPDLTVDYYALIAGATIVQERRDIFRALKVFSGPPDDQPDALVEQPVTYVQSARVDVDGVDRPVLICTVWDSTARVAQLAVFSPDPADSGKWTWQLHDEYDCDGLKYAPDLRGDYDRHVRAGTLVLSPPPFTGKDTAEALFKDTEAFIRRWVLLSDARMYTAATAWCLLTWRYHDASLPKMPIFRVGGGSGAGKGRVVDVLSLLCWRSYRLQTTPDNGHWFVTTYGDVTQFFDECHLDRGRGQESQEKMIDVLDYGYEAAGEVTRVINNQLRAFKVFGARILIGYGFDEHHAITRRTVAIRMEEGLTIPEAMQCAKFPAQFYADAEHLRGRMLAWRGREYLTGTIAAEKLYRELAKRIGVEVSDTFWPLIAMIPESMGEARETILKVAESRAEAFAAARKADGIAFLLAEVAGIVRRGEGLPQADGAWIVPTRLIVDHMPQTERHTMQSVVAALTRAGLEHGQFRLPTRHSEYGWRPKGFRLVCSDPKTAAIMERYGVELAPPGTAEL